ncbi:hypothetical protein SDC9_129653 [bioreactor metagenome]|uniref:Uncharacterized protein n=2 Tax=root TaxID=1 RepID=A0A645D1E2_9ZZZZ
MLAAVEAVTLEDVHVLARELFTVEPTLAVVGPWDEDRTVSLG